MCRYSRVFLKCLSPVNPFGATRYLRPFLNTSSCVELRPSTLYFSPERHPIPATAKEGPRCERTVYGSSLLLQIRSGVPVEKQKSFPRRSAPRGIDQLCIESLVMAL
uniref:Uncharacterized protein n=1 Tax=Sipha flava TaxID=143950 RepID=A0A2S2R9N8_9HEMI